MHIVSVNGTATRDQLAQTRNTLHERYWLRERILTKLGFIGTTRPTSTIYVPRHKATEDSDRSRYLKDRSTLGFDKAHANLDCE